jgi:hypothetical protein
MRTAVQARRIVTPMPAASAATNNATLSPSVEAKADAMRPVPRATPEVQTSACRMRTWRSVPTTGSSCSSHARMPVSATASAMVEVVSLAASYLTCRR